MNDDFAVAVGLCVHRLLSISSTSEDDDIVLALKKRNWCVSSLSVKITVGGLVYKNLIEQIPE